MLIQQSSICYNVFLIAVYVDRPEPATERMKLLTPLLIVKK